MARFEKAQSAMGLCMCGQLGRYMDIDSQGSYVYLHARNLLVQLKYCT